MKNRAQFRRILCEVQTPSLRRSWSLKLKSLRQVRGSYKRFCKTKTCNKCKCSCQALKSIRKFSRTAKIMEPIGSTQLRSIRAARKWAQSLTRILSKKSKKGWKPCTSSKATLLRTLSKDLLSPIWTRSSWLLRAECSAGVPAAAVWAVYMQRSLKRCRLTLQKKTRPKSKTLKIVRNTTTNSWTSAKLSSALLKTKALLSFL